MCVIVAQLVNELLLMIQKIDVVKRCAAAAAAVHHRPAEFPIKFENRAQNPTTSLVSRCCWMGTRGELPSNSLDTSQKQRRVSVRRPEDHGSRSQALSTPWWVSVPVVQFRGTALNPPTEQRGKEGEYDEVAVLWWPAEAR